MVIKVQSDSSALNLQRNLLRANNASNTSSQRLASGFRINSAKDDAAGLFISNQLSAQLLSQYTSIRNANDGISIAQVSEGALQEVNDILLRTRELALAASSGQNSPEARAALDAEFQQLTKEVTRIASDTEFGGQNLLAGGNSFEIQVGEDAGQSVSVQTPDVSGAGAALSGVDLLSAGNASSALAVIDQQLSTISSARTELGASQSRLSSSISNQQNSIQNVADSRSRIRDADFATETSNQTKNNLLQNISNALAGQANITNRAALSLLGG